MQRRHSDKAYAELCAFSMANPAYCAKLEHCNLSLRAPDCSWQTVPVASFSFSPFLSYDLLSTATPHKPKMKDISWQPQCLWEAANTGRWSNVVDVVVLLIAPLHMMNTSLKIPGVFVPLLRLLSWGIGHDMKSYFALIHLVISLYIEATKRILTANISVSFP